MLEAAVDAPLVGVVLGCVRSGGGPGGRQLAGKPSWTVDGRFWQHGRHTADGAVLQFRSINRTAPCKVRNPTNTQSPTPHPPNFGPSPPPVVELSRQVSRISPLGDPTPHLSTLAHLMSLEPLARAATSARQWLPDLRVATGRAAVLPGACWLGPFFNIRCEGQRARARDVLQGQSTRRGCPVPQCTWQACLTCGLNAGVHREPLLDEAGLQLSSRSGARQSGARVCHACQVITYVRAATRCTASTCTVTPLRFPFPAAPSPTTRCRACRPRSPACCSTASASWRRGGRATWPARRAASGWPRATSQDSCTASCRCGDGGVCVAAFGIVGAKGMCREGRAGAERCSILE